MNKKTKTVCCLAALLALAIVLPLTKPARAQHEAWLKETYGNQLDMIISLRDPTGELFARRYAFHDYAFFSTMEDRVSNPPLVVSMGYLGRVGKPLWR
jgi:hypothetical protein